MNKFVPVKNYIVIRPLENKSENKTKSGLYLPTKSDNKKNCGGTVIAIGDEVSKKIKLNDVIYYNTDNIREISFDGEIKYIITEDDIIGILVKD